MTSPVERLVAAAGAPSSTAALGTAWATFVAAASAAFPTIAIDEPALATFVGERLAEAAELATALAAAPAGDLALAAACAAGDPAAHAAFDSAILVEVEAAGAATRAPRDLVDEVKQVLRVQLLVPKPDRPAAIAGYRGKGPLRGWVRITATRELVRHKKKRDRESPTGEVRTLDEALGAKHDDPLMSQLKAQYRSEFAAALRDAIAALDAEDRTLLRQQIVDQLSIDEIGTAYGVHRATAARWLVRARDKLVEATHAGLATRLEVPVDEIESVIRLVQSRLDASMVRMLDES